MRAPGRGGPGRPSRRAQRERSSEPRRPRRTRRPSPAPRRSAFGRPLPRPPDPFQSPSEDYRGSYGSQRLRRWRVPSVASSSPRSRAPRAVISTTAVCIGSSSSASAGILSSRLRSPASTLVLRHSDFQLPRLAHSRLLGGSGLAAPEIFCISLFLGDLRHACPGSPIPVEPLEQSLRDQCSDVSLHRRRLPSLPTRRLPPRSFFRGSNSAACVLAVYASQPGSSLDHARLASGWRPCLAGREFNPPGRCVRFAITCWRSHGFLLTEASRRTAR